MKKLLLIALVCLAGPICAKTTDTLVEKSALAKKVAAAKKLHLKKVLVAKKKAQLIADKKIAEKKAVHAKAAAVKKAALAKKVAVAKAEATKVAAAKKAALAKKAVLAKAAAVKKAALAKKAVLAKAAVVKKAAPVKKVSEPSKPRAKVKVKKSVAKAEKKKETHAEVLSKSCRKYGGEVVNGKCYGQPYAQYEACTKQMGAGPASGAGQLPDKTYFDIYQCTCPWDKYMVQNSDGTCSTCRGETVFKEGRCVKGKPQSNRTPEEIFAHSCRDSGYPDGGEVVNGKCYIPSYAKYQACKSTGHQLSEGTQRLPDGTWYNIYDCRR